MSSWHSAFFPAATPDGGSFSQELMTAVTAQHGQNRLQGPGRCFLEYVWQFLWEVRVVAEFYCFPQWILTALVMIAAVSIMLQTLAVSFSLRRLPAGWGRRGRKQDGMRCPGGAVSSRRPPGAGAIWAVRRLLDAQRLRFGPSNCFCWLRCWAQLPPLEQKSIWPFFFVIAAAAVLFPMTEEVPGLPFPSFFLTSLLYFLVRSVHICLMRRQGALYQISAVSVKEAIDTLHTGLLFFPSGGGIFCCATNRWMGWPDE